MPEFLNEFVNEFGNDIYILISYLAAAIMLIGLALITWRGKKNDEISLRKLENQIRKLSEKQSINND